MKPCAKNHKLIALLAMDELGREPARELRAHLETCVACRLYYQEISGVAETLSSVEANEDIRTSTAFHRRVVNALKAERPPGKASWLEQFCQSFASRPAAWLAAGTVAIVVAALVIFAPPPQSPGLKPVMANSAPTSSFSGDLAPTIANYQMVANRSLDKLDDLLTRQGNRNPPSAPIYTASDFARVSLSN